MSNWTLNNDTLSAILTNGSDANGDPPMWTTIPIISTCCTVAAFLTNGSALLIFARRRSLRTDFSVYLITLLIFNFLNSIVQSPLDIINSLHSYWQFGQNVCTFYIYWGYCVAASMHNIHALITLNRVWAVAYPISYRYYHSRRTAVFLCFGVIIYVHAYALPGIILDAYYYRHTTSQSGCFVNAPAQRIWSLIDELLIFDLSVGIVIGAYPYVVFKHFQRRHQKVSHLNKEITTAKNAVVGSSDAVTAQEMPKSKLEKPPPFRVKQKPRGDSHGFFILTVLTISVSVCWVPIFTYFTILQFKPIESPEFYKVAISLFYVQTFMDPVYFALALRDLREEYRRLLFCH